MHGELRPIAAASREPGAAEMHRRAMALSENARLGYLGRRLDEADPQRRLGRPNQPQAAIRQATLRS